MTTTPALPLLAPPRGASSDPVPVPRPPDEPLPPPAQPRPLPPGGDDDQDDDESLGAGHAGGDRPTLYSRLVTAWLPAGVMAVSYVTPSLLHEVLRPLSWLVEATVIAVVLGVAVVLTAPRATAYFASTFRNYPSVGALVPSWGHPVGYLGSAALVGGWLVLLSEGGDHLWALVPIGVAGVAMGALIHFPMAQGGAAGAPLRTPRGTGGHRGRQVQVARG